MKKAKIGDRVKVHYTAKLKDNTVFHTSKDKHPVEFEIGAGDIIPGLEKGVVGMKEGEKKTITIPPGDGFGLSMEALVELEPDLVLAYDESLCSRIRRLGIRATSVRAETLVEVYTAYETLARAVGLPGRGQALAERVRREIEAQKQRFAGMQRKRVLVCVDGNSGHVVGPGNFVHELLTLVEPDALF